MELTCQSCGTTFQGRWGTKTCSDRCRKRLSRGVSTVTDVRRGNPLEVLKQNMGDRAPGLPKPQLSVTASSVQDAVESGDYLAQVDALRVRIAMAMDDPKTPPAALAPLSRQLQELTREREAHFTQAREERLQLVVPDDEPFDPRDI